MPGRLGDHETNTLDVLRRVELRLGRIEPREEEELAHRPRQHEAVVRVEIRGVGMAGPDLVPERERVAAEVEAGRGERCRCRRRRGRHGRQSAGARSREHQKSEQRAADENPQAF